MQLTTTETEIDVRPISRAQPNVVTAVIAQFRIRRIAGFVEIKTVSAIVLRITKFDAPSRRSHHDARVDVCLRIEKYISNRREAQPEPGAWIAIIFVEVD